MKKTIAVILALLAVSSGVLAQTARLQVIHNAADPAAENVDVYVNGNKLLDNFHFRTATPFIDVPAGVTLNIGIAPGTSTSAADTLKNFAVKLDQGKRYVAVANGVLNPPAFAGNPEGASIGFTLIPFDGAREKASRPWFVDVRIFHGATDAPAVGIATSGSLRYALVDRISYGQASRYLSLLPLAYKLDVTTGASRTVVATFNADLSALRGGAAFVFASGFLTPSANQNGASFGLFAALPNGKVVELPQIGTARLQVIHNAADPAAAKVDVYVNGTRLLDDFAFRTATPFIDVPAGVPVNIGIAPWTSTSAADTLKNFVVTFSAGRTYVAIANGVIGNSFSPNPDKRSIAFTIFPKDGAREKSVFKPFVDIMAFHGSTDAPTVDVRVKGLPFPLYNDLSYGAFSSYRTLPPWRYVLQITPGSGMPIVAQFLADLRGLSGGAAVVFASGFFNPPANQNGPAFGLFAALPNGTVVELPALTAQAAAAIADVNESDLNAERSSSAVPQTYGLNQNYPNPFNPSTAIRFSIPAEGMTSLKVYNALGQEVASLVNTVLSAGEHSVTFNAGALPSGTYYYRLTSGNFTETKRMLLVR